MHSWRNLALSFTIYSRLYKPRLIANVLTYIASLFLQCFDTVGRQEWHPVVKYRVFDWRFAQLPIVKAVVYRRRVSMQ